MWQLLILSFFTILTQSAVLGIDFGSNFVKVALVAPGHPFEIALDVTSKRKSPAIVGFDAGERRFGNEANSLVTKRPKETFMFISRLLGKSIDTPILEQFAEQYYPYQFIADEERGTIRIQFGEDKSFAVEEVVAMYLKQAQYTAMSYLDSSSMIRDCVVTVPDFWTTKERRALLNAADLAGLNVLSLINENSAAALHYGVERNYEINKTENLILYNMGSTSTKVSVVKYDAYLKSISKRKNKTVGQVTVMSQAWDETLGGNAFDMVLVSQMKAQAESDMSTDFTDNFRAMGRLREAAKKAKFKLSANRETTVRITSLYEDTDFKLKVERDDFWTNAASLFGRVLAPVDIALERAQLEKEDIDGIVLMGGGSRIPKIQDILTEYLDKPLKKDLNTDEAAALGAAFRAANESTTFRVRQIGFVDRGVYSVSATINNFDDFEAEADLENAEFRKSAEIFSSGTPLKKRKAVHFKHDNELFVSVSYTTGDGLPSGTQPHIDQYNVSGIVSAVEKYKDKNVTETKPKISLSFSLDHSGIVKLSKATATFNENVEVAIPRIKNETSTKDKKNKKDAEKADSDKKESDDAEKSTEAAEETTGTEEESDKTEGEPEAEAETPEAEAEKTEEATEDSTPEDTEGADKEQAEGTDAEKTDEAEAEKTESDSTAEESAEETDSTDTSENKSEESTESTDGSEEKSEETTEAETTTTTEEPKIEYDYVWKVQKRKVTLKVRAMGAVDVRPMGKTEIKNSTKVLLELDEADQAIRDTAAALNDLESFVLERRPLLYEDEDEYIMKISTEEEREELIALLTETEDWLFDVEEPTAGVYKAKMREVQKQVLPVFSRAYELSQRDYYVEETQKHLGVLREMAANLTETHTWVNETEFEKLNKSIDDFQEWFTGKIEEQLEKALTDEPAFRVDEIKTRVEKLSDQVKKIAIRPKPAEKPKKKKKKKKDKKSKETETANATDTSEAESQAEGTTDEAEESADEGISTSEETETTEAEEETLQNDHEEL
jgi:hypoxia up-regulated 1